MSFIKYRNASISDIPLIKELIRGSKSFFHKNKEQYVNEFIEAWGPNAYYVEDHLLLIASIESKAIGIIGMRAPNASRTFAELDLLFVDKEYIGKGYGRLLWKKIISLSNEKAWKNFRFISDNLPQITGFYEHMGAAVVDKVKLQSGDFPLMEYHTCS